MLQELIWEATRAVWSIWKIDRSNRVLRIRLCLKLIGEHFLISDDWRRFHFTREALYFVLAIKSHSIRYHEIAYDECLILILWNIELQFLQSVIPSVASLIAVNLTSWIKSLHIWFERTAKARCSLELVRLIVWPDDEFHDSIAWCNCRELYLRWSATQSFDIFEANLKSRLFIGSTSII